MKKNRSRENLPNSPAFFWLKFTGFYKKYT